MIGTYYDWGRTSVEFPNHMKNHFVPTAHHTMGAPGGGRRVGGTYKREGGPRKTAIRADKIYLPKIVKIQLLPTPSPRPPPVAGKISFRDVNVVTRCKEHRVIL